MFLNETKPPLEEALEHFGVRGMHWGVRKKRDNQDYNQGDYRDTFDLSPPKPNNHTGAKVAAAGVVVVGAVATAYVLKKYGSTRMPRSGVKLPKSPFAGKTFTPKNVGNPLWTRTPKAPKAARSFVDAGFGKNGVFNVTTMTRGAQTVNDFDAKVWEMPVKAITSGR